MLIGLAAKNPEEASAIEPLDRAPPDSLEQGGDDIDVLHHGIGDAAGLDFSRPANHQGHVEPHVVAGPLAAGKLRALLAGVDEDGVLFTAEFLHGGQAFTKLPVEISDLGVVLHQGGARLGRIHEPGRDLHSRGIVGRGISLRPRQVRAVRRDDQAIGLALLAADEFPQLCPGHVLERKGVRWTEVLLAAEADAVAQLAQKMNDAARTRLDLAVVGIGSVANRKEARVELLAGGSAHRGRGKGPGEAHSLRGEPVDIGGPDLAVSIATRIAPGLVIGQDENDIRPGPRLVSVLYCLQVHAERQEQQKRPSCHRFHVSLPRQKSRRRSPGDRLASS